MPKADFISGSYAASRGGKLAEAVAAATVSRQITVGVKPAPSDVRSWVCDEFSSGRLDGAPAWFGADRRGLAFQDWFMARRSREIGAAYARALAPLLAGQMGNPGNSGAEIIKAGFSETRIRIIEPELRVNLIFAAEREITEMCESLSRIKRACSDKDAAGAFLEESGSAIVARENALNYLAGSAGVTLGEIMRCGGAERQLFGDQGYERRFERDVLDFMRSVRDELEALEGIGSECPGALVALTRLRPSEITALINEDAIHLSPDTVIGICDPWGVGGSRLGIRLPENGADLPGRLLAAVQIEGSGDRANLGEIYDIRPDAWRRCATPSGRCPSAPPVDDFMRYAADMLSIQEAESGEARGEETEFCPSC